MAKFDDLIFKIASNESAAMKKLYTETSRLVFSVALQIVKNKQLAEDIMQETYIKIIQSATSYKGGGAVSWIVRIAKNLAINEYNKSKRQVFVDFNENESLYGEYSIEEQFADNLAIKTALSILDDTAQQIVLMYNSGLKHKEIAKLLDLPLGTVTWKYSESLKKLKEELS